MGREKKKTDKGEEPFYLLVGRRGGKSGVSQHPEVRGRWMDGEGVAGVSWDVLMCMLARGGRVIVVQLYICLIRSRLNLDFQLIVRLYPLNFSRQAKATTVATQKILRNVLRGTPW